MSFDKKLLADVVATRLIEGQGIYNRMNRSFDGMVSQGATSVDIPDLAIPLVKTAGTTATSADRKKAKAGTTMINVPLTAYAVPLAEEVLARFESNGMLLTRYLESVTLALQEKLDSLVIAAAQGSTDKSAFAGAAAAFGDVIDINKRMDVNKVPKSGRVIVVDANLAAEFFGIDVVKSAIAFNSNYLTTGTFLNFMGMTFFISGLPGQITVAGASKYTMTGIYGPGLAVIISKIGDMQEAWDGENLQKNVDVLMHAGVTLLKNEFAVVKYKP